MKPVKQWNAPLAIVLVLLLGFSVTGLTFALSSFAIAPITARLLSVSEIGNARDVTVEFVRKEAATRFAEAHRLQIRVAGRWQPWANIPKFGDGNLLDGTNAQQMTLNFRLERRRAGFLSVIALVAGPIVRHTSSFPGTASHRDSQLSREQS